jgi:hypothetical protein
VNADDFRRNFQQSYLAIHPSAIATQLKALTLWDNLDLTLKQNLIPATTPNYVQIGQVDLTVVLKNIDDTYRTVHVSVPWKADLDEDTSFCYSQHPRLGMVSTGDSIGYLRRFPKRQYNRGYTPGFCSLSIPNQYTAEAQRANSYSVVWSVFNPDHKTLPEALEILESGRKLGVVLAPYLGLCIEQGRKYPRLVYITDIVGFVQNGDPVIYEGTSDDARDYIIKVTNKIPKVK